MEKKYPGVFKATKKDGTIYYRSSITYKGKHISLGSFDESVQAFCAYLEADRILKTESLTLEESIGRNFSGNKHLLSLDKIVILHNYRDNDMYIPTPIYLMKNFFYYYLSREDVLKFDIEDLFYYSSHKIMQRDRHFFVADYGMQVNLANRYGIKNYAVEGRDYEFINGDHNDFRYENIHIMNNFHGVTNIEKNGQTLYRVKIHINGNYTVGTYESPIEAAIAYNKAIDLVKKTGINKKYTPNYIEGISASEYAEIYSNLKISNKLIELQNPQS